MESFKTIVGIPAPLPMINVDTDMIIPKQFLKTIKRSGLGKNLFLPTPHTDFIFAIIGEELGLLGTIFILSAFIFIFQRGIKIAKESTDTFGILLAIGISFNFILYGFINAAVVTGVVPTTGLPMPFISYGGSSLLIFSVMFFIYLNFDSSRLRED